jgi:two-component system sensor histidine kinase/response regulator
MSKITDLPPASAPATQQAARFAVWVVDDSPLQLEVCRAALDDQFDTRTFASGGAALEALAAGAAPQMMVLDWHMPDMSGLDVCRFIREQYLPAHLPVLILTASGDGTDVIAALNAGANDFVRKPASEYELRARVAGMVQLSMTHAALLETQRTLRIEAEFRERFMGMLAHDLRQPLYAMSLASHVLGHPEAARERAQAALGMQSRSIARMTRMIDELLDFTRSRPETGMPIQRQRTDLVEVARAIVNEMGPGWPRHEINLHTTGPCTGLWDPDRMAQVCSNLIGNALEHSSTSSPIDVRITSSGSSGELTVCNDGPAIPPDVLETLFEPYRRGRSVHPSSRGVGLGLHIVEQIVRAHGGTVSAMSSGTRTQFRIELPLESGALERLSEGSAPTTSTPAPICL